MNKLTVIVFLCVGVCAQAWSMNSGWRIMQNANQAYAFETGNKQMLGMFYSCGADNKSCQLKLALPIDCARAAGKVVEVPVRMGQSDDVAHLTCLDERVEMNIGVGGMVKVHKAGRLKDSSETEPLKIDFYNWVIDFPNQTTEAVPELDSKKKITFYIGEGKHTFNMKGSHEVFQEVYQASVGTDSSN